MLRDHAAVTTHDPAEEGSAFGAAPQGGSSGRDVSVAVVAALAAFRQVGEMGLCLTALRCM